MRHLFLVIEMLSHPDFSLPTSRIFAMIISKIRCGFSPLVKIFRILAQILSHFGTSLRG